jgi:hypothetical protein
MAGSAYARYSGGTGEPNDPYRIATAEDLNDIGDDPCDWDKHFILTNDINMADYFYSTALISPDTSSSSGFQGTPFTGIFDGAGYTVSNLTINGESCIGLFGRIGTSGEIMNLNLANVSITGSGNYVGSLCGYNEGGLINECSSNGDVIINVVSFPTEFIGGLCGFNENGSISNCYSNSSVNGINGPYSIGGLCGGNDNGNIANCISTGSVTGGYYYVGGLCGSNGGNIVNCYANSSVSSVGSGAGIGGLCGNNWGNIINCYSTGSVTGSVTAMYIGGLCGLNNRDFRVFGTISNCYTTGSVSGGAEYFGGLCGDVSGSINNSFWDIETGGPDNGGGIPKTTSEMKTKSTFTDAGWDFVEVWGIGENQTYPYLQKYPAGDINHDGIVNFLDFAILANHWMEGM